MVHAAPQLSTWLLQYKFAAQGIEAGCMVFYH
jgi:hypothetical protein